jgi:hypothetical protein
MRTAKLLLASCLGMMAVPAWAQIQAPIQLEDEGAQNLQEKYLPELKQVAADLQKHKFPYPFYFSRTLDVDEQEQRRLEPGSIRFGRYENEYVVEATGNYYAAYSAELMDGNQRARQTFLDVVLPILKTMVPRFKNNENVAAFAFEISHHVRRKVLGVTTEGPENLALLIPRAVAERLVEAKDADQQERAILESQVFRNGEPTYLWLVGDPPPGWQKRQKERDLEARALAAPLPPGGGAQPAPTVSEHLLNEPSLAMPMPARITSQDTLNELQSSHQEVLGRLTRELDSQAHFAAYAPPVFIAFHQGAYLQLSLTTTLDPGARGSQYKLAALAFDSHVSHLLRPSASYFDGDKSFDGIDFSASVRATGGDGTPTSQSVEFFFPLSSLRCYLQYDCTGQQLIDSGFVLINGERVALNLQSAESAP